MKKKKNKLYIQEKKRYLKKIVGTHECPRLAIFRSHKHIYAQLIDDQTGRTLASSSTLDKTLKESIGKQTATQQASYTIGQNIGKKALEKNIAQIIFDRGTKPYHGRIAKLAEGAREVGLIF